MIYCSVRSSVEQIDSICLVVDIFWPIIFGTTLQVYWHHFNFAKNREYYKYYVNIDKDDPVGPGKKVFDDS